MYRKYLIILLLSAVVITVVIVLYNVFAYSTISSSSKESLINNEVVGRDYEIKLHPGFYSVKLYDPLKDVSEQTIAVGLFQNIKLSNPNPDLTINKILEKSGQNVPSNITVGDYMFFKDNTWLVVNMINKNPNRDGYTIILNYKNNQWTVYSYGTGLDDDQLRMDNIEVYNYVSI